MAEPAIHALPENTWVKVATGVTQGMVWVLKTNAVYVHTYRLTGNPAPTDLTDSAPLPYPGLPISSEEAIDVYLRAEGFDGVAWVGL